MKLSKSNYESYTCIERSRYLLPLAAVAITVICSSGSLAQETASKTSPQQSDATRQRTITPAEGGRDTIVSFNATPAATSRGQRRIFVRSKSLLVRGAVVEDKLLKRPEFQQLGFAITREESEADLILELRHDLFTMYVFSVVDAKTREVVASGKLSSLGGTVAGKVSKRFLKEMAQRPPGP